MPAHAPFFTLPLPSFFFVRKETRRKELTRSLRGPTSWQSFDCTDEENDEALVTLRRRAKVDEQIADMAILTKLRTYFEERFRYDEQGVPRVWKPDDDIDGTFKKAKDVTLELISLYAKIEPEDSEQTELEYTPPEDGEVDTPGLVAFSETKALELGAQFRREADAHYVEANRSTVVGFAQVPYWIYGIVLGWNEAMLILFNPLYPCHKGQWTGGHCKTEGVLLAFLRYEFSAFASVSL